MVFDSGNDVKGGGMFLRWNVLVLVAAALCSQGCETAKGFKKDAQNAWGYLSKEDGWVQQTDRWIKENMW